MAVTSYRRLTLVVSAAMTIALFWLVGYGLAEVLAVGKADDVGLYLARTGSGALRAIGRGLVKGVPVLMRWLAVIGTAAMIWVGGGILLHGAEELGLAAPAHLVHDASEAAAHLVPAIGGALAWIVTALASGIIGLLIGGAIALALHRLHAARAH